ncbi:MAG TPA: YqaE/Pmp3 family membrane protein [Bacteroidia bacterium]
MKTITLKTLAAGLVVGMLLVSGCSVEKRHYLSGYSVSWNGGKNKVSATTKDENKLPIIAVAKESKSVSEESRQTLTASVAKTPIILTPTGTQLDLVTKTTYKQNTTFTASKSRLQADVKAMVKEAKKTTPKEKKGGDIAPAVYIILAIFIPFVAVGLATDWGMPVLWNILWCLLCGIPGIIHAFIVLNREGKL